jgi:superkiller protein 3
MTRISTERDVTVQSGHSSSRFRPRRQRQPGLLIALAWTGLLLSQGTPLDQAWDLVAKGQRTEAVRVLEQFLKSNPRNGDARLLLGSILAEEGKRAEAVSHLTEAVRLLPGSALAHNALGEALHAEGDLNRARAAFESAVKLDAKLAQGHANLGHVLMQLGEPATAADHLDRAIRLLGPSADAAFPLYLRARIYAGHGESEKAAAALQAAVKLQPDFAEAWSDLGQARKALSDDAGALAAFQRAVEFDPGNPISQYRLGAEYLRQGNASEAVRHLRESYRLDPGNQSTLYSLQHCLRQLGKLEEAERVKQELAEVLRQIDQQSQAAFAALRLNNEGAALEKAGNVAAAAEKYRAAIALDPAHIGIRVNFGVAQLRLGQWAEGLAALREALRRDPANERVKAALDDALEQAPVEFGGRGKKPSLP